MERFSNEIPGNLEIPAGWEVVPLRHLFTLSRGYPISRSQMGRRGVPCIHYGDIHGRYGFIVNIDIEPIGRIEHPDELGVGSFVGQGDFLFAGSSEDLEGSGNFTLIEGESRAIAGSDTIVAHNSLLNAPRFFAYQFDSLFVREQIRPQLMGVKVFHPSQRAFKPVRLLIPQESEQSRIASFLDGKTAEIDGLVSKLQRQRELLERYKRELIAHTVTRGLNPNAPMKDSGIDWIGQIPRNWTLLRIGALYDERSTKVSDSEFPALSVTMKGILPQLDSVAKTNDRDNRKLIRSGDFVINSRSDRRGSCGIAKQDGSCSLINIVLQPQQTIFSPYFSYLFRSALFADEFYKWGHGIVDDLWTTNWRDMKKIYVPVPPLSEQQDIVAHLDAKTSEIDGLIADLDRQVELLQKYRKQLINDVVTGKVRVCEEDK